MKILWSAWLIVALGVVSGCDSSKQDAQTTTGGGDTNATSETGRDGSEAKAVPVLVYAPDVHSFAKPNDARVSDVKLDF